MFRYFRIRDVARCMRRPQGQGPPPENAIQPVPNIPGDLHLQHITCSEHIIECKRSSPQIEETARHVILLMCEEDSLAQLRTTF